MISDLLKGLSERTKRLGRSARAGRAVAESPAPGTGVVVEYAPHHDGRPDPGEVVWAWVTFEDDPSQGKDRPVVIIGRCGERLAGIALTTKDHGPPGDRLAVGTGDWDREGRPSYAKVDRILVLDADDVRREGAAFDQSRFDVLVAAVRRRHDGRLADLARTSAGRAR